MEEHLQALLLTSGTGRKEENLYLVLCVRISIGSRWHPYIRKIRGELNELFSSCEQEIWDRDKGNIITNPELEESGKKLKGAVRQEPYGEGCLKRSSYLHLRKQPDQRSQERSAQNSVFSRSDLSLRLSS